MCWYGGRVCGLLGGISQIRVSIGGVHHVPSIDQSMRRNDVMFSQPLNDDANDVAGICNVFIVHKKENSRERMLAQFLVKM